MNLTPEMWKVVSLAVASDQTCPAWLKEQIQMDWEVVSNLPALDETTTGQPSLPAIERKLVNADYLIFLREQIIANARGPEWLALLQVRLSALEPFVGKELIVAVFHCKPHSATIRVHPETRRLVHLEAS
jgi:hypothetical protein